MTLTPPEGTYYSLPPASAQRLEVAARLRRLYDAWGYAPVDVPVLERYDPAHPAAERSFKLSDRGAEVLALRADFTPAIAGLVGLHYPEAAGQPPAPKRFQYCGKLWQALDSDMARTREYTQVGLELVGVSNARADAELIHLARESVREVGLAPRVEIGNAGFIRALFDLAGLPEWEREPLADAIDRKDARTVEHLLAPLGLPADLGRALQGTPDLYGHLEVLEAARTLAPWPETSCELDRLAAILAEFEDDSELLLDLGMARRHRYYTGMVFRAYTFDFGQPLLGGGRYDGALLPYAAGFAVGLERLLAALPTTEAWRGPAVLSVDDAGARALRAGGVIVERALHADRAGLLQYARARGIPYLLSEAGLEPLAEDTPEFERLQQLLAGAWP